MAISLPIIVPVLPSADIQRDIAWYKEKTGFDFVFGDKMYSGLQRDNLEIHLQWHADTKEDPLLGGSVIKIFVENVQKLFDEFVQRGTVPENKLRRNTPWSTHEFGFYDLNMNAIFFVEDVK
ncbi:glyoxalase/bleomycin resistance/extradiol dioxygenase family protein [Aquimarina sp. AU474]|uniref:glyoxalase/bleomycin resistance/extradiol dioxygenase family protein n=1 Tax=Aquimarina sp. AU474 TaxID=2108529 RepID=UPI000D688FDB|nr:glyoxalase/bleomycin resistance/extradiol dioxygenase family protein [Aquimarina sp. AU474]